MSAAAGDKQSAILDAAFRLFGTLGFYETKMSDIADEAGIAKGTLYLYFSSKEELFTSVTKRDFERFLDAVKQAVSGELTLEKKLQAMAASHLTYYFQLRDYTRLFFQAPNNDALLMAEMRAFLQRYNEIASGLLEEFEIAEPSLHARAFIGILDVFKMEIFFNPVFTEEDLQERIRFGVRLFRYGCKQEGLDPDR